MTNREILEYTQKQLPNYKIEQERLKETFESCILEQALNTPQVLQDIYQKYVTAVGTFYKAITQIEYLSQKQVLFWQCCAFYKANGIAFVEDDEMFTIKIAG